MHWIFSSLRANRSQHRLEIQGHELSPDWPHTDSSKQSTLPLQTPTLLLCEMWSCPCVCLQRWRGEPCVEGFLCFANITRCVISSTSTVPLSVTRNDHHSEGALPNRELLHESLSYTQKSVVWAWGHGSAGRSACWEIVRPWFARTAFIAQAWWLACKPSTVESRDRGTARAYWQPA